MGTSLILVILISIGVVLFTLVCLAFLVVSLLTRFSIRASGLDALVSLYQAGDLPEGQQRRRQTVQFGAVRYRQCVTVRIHPQGLGLRVQTGLAKSRPILIPWNEVRRVQSARLYWRHAAQLSIGEPPVTTITVYAKLFEEMTAFLPPDL